MRAYHRAPATTGVNMSTEAYEVIVATFPNLDEADETVDTLREMAKSGTIEIVDAAILKRTNDGETSVDHITLPKTGRWAGTGAIVGGVLGVIFPPSLLASAAVGAGIAAGTAALTRAALKSPELEEAAHNLEPGSSAVVAVIDAKWARQMNEAMKGYNKLAEHALDADTAAHLGIISDDETGDAMMTASAFGTDEETGTVVAGTMTTAVDGETGIAAASGAVVAADPETGEAAVAGFQAIGLADNAADDAPALDSSDEADGADEESS